MSGNGSRKGQAIFGDKVHIFIRQFIYHQSCDNPVTGTTDIHYMPTTGGAHGERAQNPAIVNSSKARGILGYLTTDSSKHHHTFDKPVRHHWHIIMMFLLEPFSYLNHFICYRVTRLVHMVPHSIHIPYSAFCVSVFSEPCVTVYCIFIPLYASTADTHSSAQLRLLLR